jgi:hypothetical protein
MMLRGAASSARIREPRIPNLPEQAAGSPAASTLWHLSLNYFLIT